MKFKQYYRQVDSERREMLRAFDAQDDMLRRQAEIILKQKEVIEVLQAQAEVFRFVVKYGIGVDHAI